MFERSYNLKVVQKKTLKSKNIKWISNFSDIKSGPSNFFGNEFLIRSQLNNLNEIIINFEKYYFLDKFNTINTVIQKQVLKIVKT